MTDDVGKDSPPESGPATERSLQLSEVIHRCAREGSHELLKGSSLREIPEDEVEEEPELVSVVGFSGDPFHGVLGIAASRTTLNACHPTTLAGEDTNNEELEDWLGELANQFAGRVKLKLMTHQISLWVARPVVLKGVSLRLLRAGTRDIRKYHFHSEFGDFVVWADLNMHKNVEIPVPKSDAIERKAGEILLFF